MTDLWIPYGELKPKKGIDYTRQHISREEKAGRFPPSFKVSEGKFARRYWLESEIDAYMANKVAARNAKLVEKEQRTAAALAVAQQAISKSSSQRNQTALIAASTAHAVAVAALGLVARPEPPALVA
jgi:predicted DNA-binding transcriptional regulator AlpA